MKGEEMKGLASVTRGLFLKFGFRCLSPVCRSRTRREPGERTRTETEKVRWEKNRGRVGEVGERERGESSASWSRCATLLEGKEQQDLTKRK